MSDHRFLVRWSAVASEDVASIGAWIARDNPVAALAVMDCLEQAAADLEQFPERGRPVREVAGLGAWLEVVVRPWRLVYRMQGAEEVVLAVFDGRRELRDVLFERLIRPNR